MRKTVPLIAVAAVVGALVGSGLALTLDRETVDGRRRIESVGLGVSIELPDGWTVSDRYPLDDLNTTELETDFGPPATGGDCPARPIFVRVRISETRLLPGAIVEPRPDRFGPGSNGGLRSFAEFECGEESQSISFSEHGRAMSIHLMKGRDATERRLAEAYAIANSLRVGVFPWGEYCTLVDQLNEERVINTATLRIVDDLAAASPTRETAKDLRRANKVLAGRESARGDALAAINRVLLTTRERCGLFAPVFTEPMVPGAIATYHETVRNGPWPGQADIDIETGSVTAPGFNEHVAENQPVWAETFPRASIELLHLDRTGGAGTHVEAVPDRPNRSLVVVSPIGGDDDSVAAVEYRLVFELGSDGLVRFVSGTWAQRCQPNRGHQEFSIELCA